MGLEVIKSPWTVHAGTVKGPYGPCTATCNTHAGFLQILVVLILLSLIPYSRVHKGAVWHPYKYSRISKH